MASAAVWLPHPADAQGVPPPPLDRAIGGTPTREELEGIRRQPAAAPTQLDIRGGIERSPCPLADPEYADVQVTIGHVTFNNLKGATPEEMEPAWRPFAGRPQPIAVVCEIRDAAATILRNKGYLAAVQVPTQRIENGEVRLEALYARVTSIRARGETRGAERKLQQYLGKLTRDEIFDRNTAERYLLLARDLPGYNVQLTLKPSGTAPGELIGEVTVLRRPYTVDLTVQNYAAESTGRWGGQLRAQAFGLTGLGDATSIALYSTAEVDEQQVLQIGHEFRPGSEGLVIAGQFTYAWTQPDVRSTTPGTFKARTLYTTLSARYPLVRSQGKNLTLGAGFDYVDQDVSFGSMLLRRDHLRVAWARADFDAVDLSSRRPAWRLNGTVELRQGVDVFKSRVLKPGDGDPRATVVRGDAEIEVALGHDLAFVLAPRGQYAFDPVTSFEQFTAGNYTVGRGYEPGTILGDNGVGASAELRGPRLKPLAAFEGRFQPYVFGDAARVWTRDATIAGVFRRGTSDRLFSVGGGVRAELGDRFRLDATLAVPLERAGLQTRRRDPQFLITFTSRLLPWRTT